MSEKQQNTTTTAITGSPETGMARIKSYLLSEDVKQRFADMMGHEALYYLNQVLITVSSSPQLLECDPKTILIAAMRAASLKLSLDPSRGEAWIIPYNKRAKFQIGYRGVYELALRTGQYRFINVITIYDGETVTEDRMTGIHSISGKPTPEKKPIGYMLYFQLVGGFEKTFYMTVEEIAEHAARYSPSYTYKDSPWNNPHERPKMEMKTVLMNGLKRWGRFSPRDREVLDQIESETSDDDSLPTVTVDQPGPEKKTRPESEIMRELGYETE